jgi:hypothetical protein
MTDPTTWEQRVAAWRVPAALKLIHLGGVKLIHPALCEPPAYPGSGRRSRVTRGGGSAAPLQQLKPERGRRHRPRSAERSEGSLDA